MAISPPTARPTSDLQTYHVKTFGCQMNEFDSERMAGVLAHNGLAPVENMLDADVVIVNTCSIREKPDQKAYSDIGRVQSVKKNNPDVVLCVAGCVAQSEREEIFRRFPGVDIVLGTRSVPSLWNLIENVRDTRNRQTALSLGGYNSALPPEVAQRGSSIKAWVTVMEGCDKFCSFCIVPFTRGREYSRPADTIVREVEFLAKQGFKEISLLGQNVNSYGLAKQSKGKEPPFWELLERLNEVQGIERIRFFTSHPRHLTDELIDVMARCDKLCEQLHLPAQSGSDSVLERMNRGYTFEEYVEGIRKLRAAIPELSLSGDMITGFCGETDEDFEKTMELIETVRYDQLYSFNYSERPHTLAHNKYPDDVPHEIKNARLQRLQARVREIAMENAQRLVGSSMEVLIDGVSKRDESMPTGRTRCNRVVNINGGSLEIGTFATVTITEAHPNCLIGELQGTA